MIYLTFCTATVFFNILLKLLIWPFFVAFYCPSDFFWNSISAIAKRSDRLYDFF